MKIQII
jgi:hypothetical protein